MKKTLLERAETREEFKKAKAKKNIVQDATEDTPAFEMAEKGQELLVIKEITGDSNNWAYDIGYRYICQDTKRRYGTFYVKENEVEILE